MDLANCIRAHEEAAQAYVDAERRLIKAKYELDAEAARAIATIWAEKIGLGKRVAVSAEPKRLSGSNLLFRQAVAAVLPSGNYSGQAFSRFLSEHYGRDLGNGLAFQRFTGGTGAARWWVEKVEQQP